jgi:hypothetical protein
METITSGLAVSEDRELSPSFLRHDFIAIASRQRPAKIDNKPARIHSLVTEIVDAQLRFEQSNLCNAT